MPLTLTWMDASPRVLPSDGDGTAVIFGRGADIDIDSNPFLHRHVGRFVFADGMWWVENLSEWSPIRIRASGTSTILAGRSRAVLAHSDTLVCFDAGPCNYEIRAHLDEVPELPPRDEVDSARTATHSRATIPLNAEQRLLVAALAEPWLLDPHHKGRMPTNRAVTRRLGWTDAKFNRKLDYLCHQLAKGGVVGMRGGGRRALDRRRRLVDHMIATHQITEEDLNALPWRDDKYRITGEEPEGTA